jgi:hypothetical protein
MNTISNYTLIFISIIIIISMSVYKSIIIEPLLNYKRDKLNYEPDDPDITYHDSVDDLISQKTVKGVVRVYDPITKELVELIGNVPETKTYYQDQNKFKYSNRKFVPDYEDSVYLSKTHGPK